VKIRKGKLDLDGVKMHYTGEEDELEAGHLVLATGSRPLMPPSVKPDHPYIVSSNRLITIGEMPESLTIVGGGVIGLEFATIFSNMGSRVTIIEFLDRVLATLDPEVSASITEELKLHGVRILTGHQMVSVEQGYVRAENRATREVVEIPGQAVLIAVGREPVTLEIEEHVVARRRGEQRQAVRRIDGLENLVLRRRETPGLQLDHGLIAHARERISGAALGLGHVAELCETLEARDVGARELFDLQSAYSGDETQVIVGAPPRVARPPPPAYLALHDGLGIRARIRGCDRLLKLSLHEPVVGLVVIQAVRLRLEAVMRRDDVRIFGPHAL